MRKLLFILLILPFFVKAQRTAPSTLPNPNSPTGYPKYGWLSVDSGYLAKQKDTTFKPVNGYSSLVYLHNKFYYYAIDSLKWLPINPAGITTAPNWDSVMRHGADLFQSYTSNLHENSLSFDSAGAFSVLSRNSTDPSASVLAAYPTGLQLYNGITGVSHSGIVITAATSQYSSYSNATGRSSYIDLDTAFFHTFSNNPVSGRSSALFIHPDSIAINSRKIELGLLGKNVLVGANTASLPSTAGLLWQDSTYRLYNSPISDLAGLIIPQGLPGQILINDSASIYHAADIIDTCKCIYSDEQLEAMKQVYVPQSVLITTLQRGSEGGLSGEGNEQVQGHNNDTIPNRVDQTNSFVYDMGLGLVKSTINSGGYIYMYFPLFLTTYFVSATVSANPSTDNDRIGLQLAIFNDAANLVRNNAYGLNPTDFNWPINVTDSLIPFQHTLSVFRNRNGATLSYYVVYDAGLLDEKIIYDGSGLLTYFPTSNWNGAGTQCKLSATRDGNIIKIFTTEFADAPGGEGALGHEIDVDLTSDPVLAKFMTGSYFGFSAQSQAFAYWQDATYSDNNQYIYDLRDGAVWTPDATGTYSIDATLNAYELLGQRRIVYNPYTTANLYLPSNNHYFLLNKLDTLSEYTKTTYVDSFQHQNDSLFKLKIDTVTHTILYDTTFTTIPASFVNPGAWTTTTGGMTSTGTGLANYIELNKQYNLNKRGVDINVSMGSDTRFLIFTRALESNDVYGTMVEADVAAGKMRIYQAYATSSLVLPSVAVEKAYTFIANRNYRLSLLRNQNTNTFIVLDLVTGLADTLVEANGNSGRQYDAYAMTNYSGTAPIVASMSVHTPYPVGVWSIWFGDSITDGVYLPSINDDYAELYDNSQQYRGGRSGRGSGDIVGVMRRIISEATPLRPKYIPVLIGTNGGNTTARLDSLIAAIRAIGAVPILCKVPWRGNGANISINALITTRANAAGVKMIPMDSATSHLHLNISQDSSIYYSDGGVYIHPNAAGQYRMYQQIIVSAPELFSSQSYNTVITRRLNVSENGGISAFSTANSFVGTVIRTNERYVNATTGPGDIYVKHRGTEANPLAAQKGDVTFSILGLPGYDSSNRAATAGNQIESVIVEAPVNAATSAGMISIYTVPHGGAGVKLLAMRITNYQQVYIGKDTTYGDTITPLVAYGIALTNAGNQTAGDSVISIHNDKLVKAHQNRLPYLYNGITSTAPNTVTFQGLLDTLVGNVFCYAGNSSTGKPTGVNSGYVQQWQLSTTERYQMFYTENVDSVYHRTLRAGTWGSWYKFIDTKNQAAYSFFGNNTASSAAPGFGVLTNTVGSLNDSIVTINTATGQPRYLNTNRFAAATGAVGYLFNQTTQQASSNGNLSGTFVVNSTRVLPGNVSLDIGHSARVKDTAYIGTGIDSGDFRMIGSGSLYQQSATSYSTGGFTDLVWNNSTGRYETIPFAQMVSYSSSGTVNVPVTKIYYVYADCNSGDITLTFTPSLVNQCIRIKRVDNTGNTLTIAVTGGTVDAGATTTISGLASKDLVPQTLTNCWIF